MRISKSGLIFKKVTCVQVVRNERCKLSVAKPMINEVKSLEVPKKVNTNKRNEKNEHQLRLIDVM